MERRASIDVLACPAILLRLDLHHGDPEQVWEFARSIFRVLLMLGDHFEDRRIANALFMLYAKRVLNMSWKGRRFYLGDYEFPQWSRILLHFGQNTQQTRGRKIDRIEHIHYMRKVLSGDYGLI
jgi:hypothetical protein